MTRAPTAGVAPISRDIRLFADASYRWLVVLSYRLTGDRDADDRAVLAELIADPWFGDSFVGPRPEDADPQPGSMLARRLLVESAWHYGRPPSLGAALTDRQAGQPDHVLQISNGAQQRLHKVNRRMKTRGKPHNVVVVACARELSCFLWAAATAD